MNECGKGCYDDCIIDRTVNTEAVLVLLLDLDNRIGRLCEESRADGFSIIFACRRTARRTGLVRVEKMSKRKQLHVKVLEAFIHAMLNCLVVKMIRGRTRVADEVCTISKYNDYLFTSTTGP
jgi:hypothetical protein